MTKNNKSKLIHLLLVVIVFIIMALINLEMAKKATVIAEKQLITMIKTIPAIFVLMGLMDVWIDKETMMILMGENSGFKGAILSFVIGSCAAGPLYGAFPLAAVLLKKGASLTNIMIFIGAWSTTKIPMLLFEISALGYKFAFTRLALDIVVIIIMAIAIDKTTSKEEKETLYENAKKL